MENQILRKVREVLDPLPEDHNPIPESLPGSLVYSYRRAKKNSDEIRKITKLFPFIIVREKNYVVLVSSGFRIQDSRFTVPDSRSKSRNLKGAKPNAKYPSRLNDSGLNQLRIYPHIMTVHLSVFLEKLCKGQCRICNMRDIRYKSSNYGD